MSSDATAPGAAPPPAAASFVMPRWEETKRRIASLLLSREPDAAWLARLRAEQAALRELAQANPDAALYLLVQMSSSELDRYSAHHAMLCAVVAELGARWLDFDEEAIDSLVGAALTMNLSMSATQDALAQQKTPLSSAQRGEVDDHPARSSAMLVKAGLEDALWLAVVQHHHDETSADPSSADTAPMHRLAQLLHRVDVYTAKLSRRASRQAASPSIAARDACLNAAGLPDAIGATLLRVLGLYPPGTFVHLRSGEVGIVIRRGAKAHTPVVAVVRRADGGLVMPPARRDTALPSHAVVKGVTMAEVKVHLNHEKALGAN